LRRAQLGYIITFGRSAARAPQTAATIIAMIDGEKELEYCEQFRPFGYRYYKGCTDRARYRHNLCVRNGGKPDPNEPDPYGWNDIPRDDADR
jgi:hypothetical protein